MHLVPKPLLQDAMIVTGTGEWTGTLPIVVHSDLVWDQDAPNRTATADLEAGGTTEIENGTDQPQADLILMMTVTGDGPRATLLPAENPVSEDERRVLDLVEVQHPWIEGRTTRISNEMPLVNSGRAKNNASKVQAAVSTVNLMMIAEDRLGRLREEPLTKSHL